MSKLNLLIQNKNADEESHWIATSDLMAGLMIIFLFIAVAFMSKTQDISLQYQQIQKELTKDLANAFPQETLQKWNAKFDKENLMFVFDDKSKCRFDQNKAKVKPECKKVLKEFFPLLMGVVYKKKNRQHIKEFRIEGHTSSEGNPNHSRSRNYFANMRLSSERASAILESVFNLPNVVRYSSWIQKRFVAVGASYSNLIYFKGTNKEDRSASRRVTFRILTRAEEQMRKIANTFQEN